MMNVLAFMEENTVDIHRVLDIGANVGHWSLFLKSRLPNVEFVMIEANPDCGPFLEEIKKNTGIPYINTGLSSSTGMKTFYKNPENNVCTGTSYYQENTDYYNNPKTQLIKCKSMKDLVAENPDILKPFNYIKLDTQGSERDIMDGFPDDWWYKTKFIQLELSLVEYNKGAPMSTEMVRYMSNRNFYPMANVETHYMNDKVIQRDWIFERQS